MLNLSQLAVVSSSVIIEQVVNVDLVIVDIIDAGAAVTFNEETLMMTFTVTVILNIIISLTIGGQQSLNAVCILGLNMINDKASHHILIQMSS